MGAGASTNGNQQHTITSTPPPIETPCDSPKVVKRNIDPKVLDIRETNISIVFFIL